MEGLGFRRITDRERLVKGVAVRTKKLFRAFSGIRALPFLMRLAYAEIEKRFLRCAASARFASEEKDWPLRSE